MINTNESLKSAKFDMEIAIENYVQECIFATNPFDNDFDRVLKIADHKYQLRKSKYGVSWKDMSIDQLEKRLLIEFDEYGQALTDDDKLNEVIDIINISLMLAEIIRKRQTHG